MQKSENISKNPTSSQAAAEAKADVPLCLNCDTTLLGDYCYQCGQKSDVKPFTLKTLVTHLYRVIRKFDAEVKTTFLGLLIYPGRFCRRYLDGKRKPFIDPVKYFFVSFVFQITVFGLVRHIAENPEIDEAANIDTEFQIISLAINVFWAIAYTIVFYRQANLAESMVCMLYLHAETRIFSVVIHLLFLPFATVMSNEYAVQETVSLAVSFVYFVVFSHQFFNQSLVRVTIKNLLVLLTFVVVFIPLLFLGFLTEDFFKGLLR